jgi:hypothetical protein
MAVYPKTKFGELGSNALWPHKKAFDSLKPNAFPLFSTSIFPIAKFISNDVFCNQRN